MNGGSKRSCAWFLLGLVACRATPGEEPVLVGAAGLWADGERVSVPPPAGPDAALALPCDGLGRSLRRVRESFEAGAGRTRIVALLDHRLDGVEAVREVARRAEAGDSQFILIWDGEPGDGAWCAGLPRDGRVAAFVDGRGVAGRAFARGLLATARAREVYLVYGPETRWPVGAEGSSHEAGPPRPRAWWHRMGRLAPSRHVADVSALTEKLVGELKGDLPGRK